VPSRWVGQPMNSASILDRGKQILFAPKTPDWLWVPLRFIYSRFREKRSGCEADHSPPSGHEVKK